MLYPAPSTTVAVPGHLAGTRAALFHLLRAPGRRPMPAAIQPPVKSPLPTPLPTLVLAPRLDPVGAALQADEFVFARSA